MRDPPCYIGAAKTRRWLTATEHLLGVHFDSCKGGGYLTDGHNEVMRLYAQILRNLGFDVRVGEFMIGRKPGRTKTGKEHARQRIDAIATNWMGKEGRTRLGIDTTIGGALVASKLAKAASTDLHVVSTLEKTKESLKAELCHTKRLDFLTVAIDSLSAWGAEATKIVVDGYAAKLARAKTDQEKWAIINEKQHLVATISLTVQKRNACILIGNAQPMGGGFETRPDVRLDPEPGAHMMDDA